MKKIIDVSKSIYTLEVAFDPAELTPETVKRIQDAVVAEIAAAATGPRGEVSSYEKHSKAHVKWGEVAY